MLKIINEDKISNEHLNINIEIYRAKFFCNIVKNFINNAVSILNSKIFSVKKSFPRTLINLLSSWMFNLYSSPNFNPKLDPFLANNFNEVECLKETLEDLVHYDETLKNTDVLIKKLLDTLIKTYEEQLNYFYSYKKNINKINQPYSVCKIEHKQVRQNEKNESETISFYKFITNAKIDFYDKRLNNILNNILIPYDEYDKLKLNYSGPKDKLDEYIWIILFRYQLLGSNNYQLGVNPSVLKNMIIDYDLSFELFASSINTSFNNYCSVYYDVEKYFGSKGSFYNVIPLSGTYDVNPPYQKNIINSCLNKLLEHLNSAQENNRKLTFIISVPIWDSEGKKIMTETYNNNLPQQNIDYGDFETLTKVKQSSFCKCVRMIPKNEFTYYDHNFKLYKNKTIQNTYMFILSTTDIDSSKLLSYDFK